MRPHGLTLEEVGYPADELLAARNKEARNRRTLPGTAKAVTAAGIILAGTFAAVGLVPLAAFQQIAFTMAAGLLIDTVLVRPVLTPALLSLLGRAALWPSRAGSRRMETDGGR